MNLTTNRSAADGKAKRNTGGVGGLVNLIGAGLAIASVVQEIRKPPRKRTWHGMLFGRIPYDWRRPTAKRVRCAFWQPRSRRLMLPTAFGVGWTVNLAAVLRPLGHLV